jgi:hypothetical protein
MIYNNITISYFLSDERGRNTLNWRFSFLREEYIFVKQ